MAGKQAKGQATGEKLESVELRLAKAMAHPVRIKALELMNEGPIAPVEVSDKIGVALSNVSYHFRTLLELDCIEATGTEQVRGSIKTTYKTKVRLMFDDMVWAGLGTYEKEGLSTGTLKSVISRTLDAFEARTFEAKEDRHLSVSTIEADWQGWDEIVEILRTAMDRVHEIGDESRERVAAGDSVGVSPFPVTVGLLGFESPRTYE